MPSHPNFRPAARPITLCAAALIGAMSMTLPAAPAAADSCWMHNGSLMRLVAQGNERWFYYEQPRQVLAAGGVQPGTLLFNGRKVGNGYVGTARVFSKYCPGAPMEYSVKGPVEPNQTTVTLFGDRPIHQQCQNTGEYKTDRLVFTYSHQC